MIRPARRSHRALPRSPNAPAAAAMVFALAVALSGCANADAQAQARQACTHVSKALSLYQRAQSEPAEQAVTDTAASQAELRFALPIAAVAAGQSAHWQPLMTTLSETSRVPEAYLVHALTAECNDATSGGL